MDGRSVRSYAIFHYGMYIVISGVHGIGKTTIARELARKLDGVCLSEVVDEAIPPPKLGPGTDALRTQLWFVRQMILKESQMTDTSAVYVADRGWSDIIAYSNVTLDEHARNIFRSVFDRLPKRLPDVQFVVNAPIEIVEERIMRRNRLALSEWNERDRPYMEALAKEFRSYHDAYKDLRPVYLLDATGSIEENCADALEMLVPHLPKTAAVL